MTRESGDQCKSAFEYVLFHVGNRTLRQVLERLMVVVAVLVDRPTLLDQLLSGLLDDLIDRQLIRSQPNLFSFTLDDRLARVLQPSIGMGPIRRRCFRLPFIDLCLILSRKIAYNLNCNGLNGWELAGCDGQDEPRRVEGAGGRIGGVEVIFVGG